MICVRFSDFFVVLWGFLWIFVLFVGFPFGGAGEARVLWVFVHFCAFF